MEFVESSTKSFKKHVNHDQIPFRKDPDLSANPVFPFSKKFIFPLTTIITGPFLGFFCFGEDLLDLKERFPLGLRHAEGVEQVAGQSDTGKYPEVEKTK